MKKYLMTGVAALALCAGFTACSNDEDFSFNENEYVESQKALIEAKYQQAFVNAFGQPAKNHTWGFGNYATRATGEFANHIGAYPDANMWTSKGFLAPDPLTHAQKLRAQYYFQMNKIVNPNRPDYGTIDYFMQQVYDGGTDPMAGKSPEVYKSIANTDIKSGDHMDHLTSGPGHLHIYNFNNGTCSTNPNVANRDQTDVNNTSQQHSDEIQLMLNTPTSCFGYANSDASYVRDDRWTLVSAKTIDDFCDSDANFATWLASKLNEGEVDKKCDDEFHRDFIGFDFDMIPDNETYAWNWANGQKTTPVTVKYNWASPQGGNLIYTEDGQWSTFTDWNAEITVKNGKVFRALVAQTNMYCGEVKGMGGMDGHSEWTETAAYDPNGTNDNSLYLNNIPGHQSDHRALNLKFLAKKYEEGWLPVDSKQLKLWVKVGGCNDGYFSDWIVTFKPADSGVEPNEIKVRILCEDMNAGTEKGDFDFNDAVVDLTLDGEDVTTANVTKIEILHTGAQFDIYVDGHEVHQALGLNKGQFGSGHAEFTPSANDLKAADIKIVTHRDFTYTNAQGEKVTVKEELELGAPQGKAPAKILVGVDCAAPDERQAIDAKYELFTTWVVDSNPNRAPFWRNNNND